MALEHVKNIMVKDLVVTAPQTPVKNVVKLMKERNVGSVLVVDSNGKLIGIFTERDLVRLVAEGLSLEIPVGEVMSKDLLVAHETDSIASLANKMLERWIRHIPVVNVEGKPVGIVSIRDVLRHVLAACLFP